MRMGLAILPPRHHPPLSPAPTCTHARTHAHTGDEDMVENKKDEGLDGRIRVWDARALHLDALECGMQGCSTERETRARYLAATKLCLVDVEIPHAAAPPARSLTTPPIRKGRRLQLCLWPASCSSFPACACTSVRPRPHAGSQCSRA